MLYDLKVAFSSKSLNNFGLAWYAFGIQFWVCCEQSDWILDVLRAPLLNFVLEKYLLEIPELGGVLSWLDGLMKF